MHSELLYQLALTQIPQIGAVQARILTHHFERASDIFKAKKSTLEKIEGIGKVRAENIRSFSAFASLEKEIKFIEKYNITPLFIKDADYPQRLLNCYDPPTLLFYRGTANLNTAKVIAIIGTRNCTDYGKHFVEELVVTLAQQNALVVSGLAYGIDAAAHKACIKHKAPTVGVLAHGLQTIYPTAHKALAKEMLAAGGGLLTEYTSETPPDRHHFPHRNRIVAGLCDATVVVETGIKGGSMITAEMAYNYNRDVFALPGRTTDAKSAGCNHLIKQQKAQLITCGNDLIQMMNWDLSPRQQPAQRQLFMDITPDEQKIVDALQQQERHIDEIYRLSGLSSSHAAAAILQLELQGVVQALPGKYYRLV